MVWKLFIDDERYPVHENEWTIARDFDDAAFLVLKQGVPVCISFDHDLGHGPTGYDFAKWFCNYIVDNEIELPKNFQYYVHSMNPVGRENIRIYMDKFLNTFNKK